MSQGKITEKQKEILEFIKETILSKGYPPAVREICEAVHLKSTSSVHSHLDKVVALLGDSATVKTFYKESGHVRLQPENSSMDPIIVDDVQILGKVIGLFRFMN